MKKEKIQKVISLIVLLIVIVVFCVSLGISSSVTYRFNSAWKNGEAADIIALYNIVKDNTKRLDKFEILLNKELHFAKDRIDADFNDDSYTDYDGEPRDFYDDITSAFGSLLICEDDSNIEPVITEYNYDIWNQIQSLIKSKYCYYFGVYYYENNEYNNAYEMFKQVTSDDSNYSLAQDYLNKNNSSENTANKLNNDESELATKNQFIKANVVDKNGSHYEIVANIEESYTGSELKIGVIKNGKWLIKPTSDNPFIDNNDIDYSSCWDKDGSDFENKYGNNILEYLGNGTFYKIRYYYKSTIYLWNVESNSFIKVEGLSIEPDITDLCCNDKIILLQEDTAINGSIRGSMLSLDTKTLKLTELYSYQKAKTTKKYTQISENLFYVDYDFVNNKNVGTFYYSNGKKAFDLTEFDNEDNTITNVYGFKNGECEITVEIATGKKYNLYIDKTGKVLRSAEID